MILLIDNYDSFTWNLYQYFCELGADVQVKRNDELTLSQIDALQPQKIVISPGPGTPADAGVSIPIVRAVLESGQPLLGVCLGHQAIAEAMGAVVTHAEELMHGKTSRITHDGSAFYDGVPQPFLATRYGAPRARRGGTSPRSGIRVKDRHPEGQDYRLGSRSE